MALSQEEKLENFKHKLKTRRIIWDKIGFMLSLLIIGMIGWFWVSIGIQV